MPPVQSVRGRCGRCHHAIWVSLRSPRGTDKACNSCVAEMARGRVVPVAPLTPEQITDIQNYRRKNPWLK